MRFVAEECLDGRIIQRLIADGHDLVVVRTDVLRIAQERNALLITEDKDFGDLVFRLNAVHAGVVLVRMHGLPGANQADLVSLAIRERGAQLVNAFTVITEKRLRVRRV